MAPPRIALGRRLSAVSVPLVIVALFVLGWLWLRSPQPPSGQIAQETTAAPAQKAPASAGREDGTPVAQPAAAAVKQEDHHGKLANLDTRAAAGGRGDDRRQRTLAALREKVRGVEEQFDPITGAPNHIMATGRFLPGGKARPGDADASVREFVNQYAELVGHDATALNDSWPNRRWMRKGRCHSLRRISAMPSHRSRRARSRSRRARNGCSGSARRNCPTRSRNWLRASRSERHVRRTFAVAPSDVRVYPALPQLASPALRMSCSDFANSSL
jgi:hypothetical protein